MIRIYKIIAITFILISLVDTTVSAQNVTEENSEAYLKEFDFDSFKDADTKIKDSTILYQHLIGVKYGYSMSGVTFSQSNKHKSFNSIENYGLYYTYMHPMLGRLPYFGIQIGLASTQLGYTHVEVIDENKEETIETKQAYSAVEFPMLALFRADLKRLRFSIGAGGFGYYIYDTDIPGGIPTTTNKSGFGLIGQAGIAIKFLPFEFHIDANYKYGLTSFLDPKIYSSEMWVYTHPTQIQISGGLFFNFGGKYRKQK